MDMFHRQKAVMPTKEQALKGRAEPMPIPARHHVLDAPLVPPADAALAIFGLGCFWGAERRFWTTPGVVTTAVGYAAGFTENPTYEEVCSGRTGHNEVVQVAFDPAAVDFETLLRVFWESHDPTQGMRQGNDLGTQYRSGIYTFGPQQQATAEASRERYQQVLSKFGYGTITTEVVPAGPFYYAEAYHQQYLAKNPAGYCGLGGTGVTCPVGLAVQRDAR